MLLAVTSILMNQQYILNKVSLNRNTHEIRLCIDWLTKNGSREPNPVFPIKAMLPYTLVQCSR